MGRLIQGALRICARSTGVTREGADGYVSSLGLHCSSPAEQAHSGSFGGKKDSSKQAVKSWKPLAVEG